MERSSAHVTSCTAVLTALPLSGNSLSIVLKSQPRDAPTPLQAAQAAAPAAAAGAAAAPAAPGKATRPPTAVAVSSAAVSADAAAAAAAPAAPYMVNVKLAGLPGLEQELPAVPGHTQQLGPQQ